MRGVERVTRCHRNTQGRLIRFAGLKADRLMARLFRGLEVSDVQVDEVWSYVAMRRKTAERKGRAADPFVGDSWTFFGIERHTKLVLAHQTGKRTEGDAFEFCSKLADATAGSDFQLSSDGLAAYAGAVANTLGTGIDYAQLIKHYAEADKDSRRKYAPARIIGMERKPISGSPDLGKLCTSHIERLNGTFRRWTARATRLTYAFSKVWKQHCRAVSLFAFTYNFCRVHGSLKTTPAVAAGVAGRAWTFADLFAA